MAFEFENDVSIEETPGKTTDESLRIQPKNRTTFLSSSDLQKHPESDPILDVLPQSFQPEYLSVRRDVREKLVNGLQNTLRWQNLYWEEAPRQMNPDFHENDLQHVIGLVEWCNQIEKEYPELYEEITHGNREIWHLLLSMIVVHDIGEIKLGDVTLTNQGTKEGIKKKKLEPRWARYLIQKTLPREQAQMLIPLYNRFENPADDDIIALTAKFLDKAQASGHVAQDIIPYNMGQPDYIQFEFQNNLPQTISPAAKIMALLKSPEATRQLQLFIREHVINHFDALEIADIGMLRGEIRDKFPIIFSH